MAIVIDVNLLVVLVTRDPRDLEVERCIDAWLTAGNELHAPLLLVYELANALTRLVASGRLDSDELTEAWARLRGIPVRLHQPNHVQEITAIALKLGRQNAYDAAYLVLAEQLDAELWTLDGPLARNASGPGFPVHLA